MGIAGMASKGSNSFIETSDLRSSSPHSLCATSMPGMSSHVDAACLLQNAAVFWGAALTLLQQKHPEFHRTEPRRPSTALHCPEAPTFSRTPVHGSVINLRVTVSVQRCRGK